MTVRGESLRSSRHSLCIVRFLTVCALGVVSCCIAGDPQPNPPSWPDSVYVFGPDSNLNEINAAVEEMSKSGRAILLINDRIISLTISKHSLDTFNKGPDNNGQFSDRRYAFLFKPGTYDVEIDVG